MQQSVDDIILENMERYGKLHAYYNPITGEGSVIDRQPVTWEDGETYYLPTSMYAIPEAERLFYGETLEPHEYELVRIRRFWYDYEYYAYVCQKIKPKAGGDPIPFKLNFAQRTKLLPIVDEFIRGSLPIRAVIVKARQEGFSTLINGLMEWIQTIHMKGWDSCIATLVESQALTIRGMYSTIAEHSPLPMMLGSYEGSSKIKYYKERNSTITVGSTERPDSLRSGAYKMAHLSECGLWKGTKNRSPDDLVQSIRGAIPDSPFTCVFLESTAKGVGNFFHDEYLSTLNETSEYKAVFASWFDSDEYERVVEDPETFVSSWSKYEKSLWTMGATIEGIAWYRKQLASDFKGDTWRMFSEFPSTVEEAFSSTGKKFFNREMVARYKTYVREPQWIGDLSNKYFRDPKKIVTDLTYEEFVGGRFFVWAKPDPVQWRNRYLIVVDTGGKFEKADFSVISVYDRLSVNYKLKLVARYRARDEVYIIAYKAMQIATWYQTGLLIIESNYYEARRPEVHEMNTFEVVLDKVVDNYPNLYAREPSEEQIKQNLPGKWGFHMNVKTKPRAYSKLSELLEQDLVDEPDTRAVAEFDQIEVKSGIEATQGLKDDIADTDAIASDVDSQLPEPRKVDTNQTAHSNHVSGVAGF